MKSVSPIIKVKLQPPHLLDCISHSRSQSSDPFGRYHGPRALARTNILESANRGLPANCAAVKFELIHFVFHFVRYSDDNDRTQRRSALVARELSRLDIDIAALSEVRFAEEGSLLEHGAGYTFFCSGRGKEEDCRSGVGFMMKNNIAKKLHALPTGHSDRIMSL